MPLTKSSSEINPRAHQSALFLIYEGISCEPSPAETVSGIFEKLTKKIATIEKMYTVLGTFPNMPTIHYVIMIIKSDQKSSAIQNTKTNKLTVLYLVEQTL
jgi:hypothetical protein